MLRHPVSSRSPVTLGLQQRPCLHPSVSPRSVGPLPSSAVAQGTRLLIRSLDESINTTFICYVTNVLGTGKAELTVMLREPPRDLSDPYLSHKNIIIIIIVVVIAVAVFTFLIYWLFRRSRKSPPLWYTPSVCREYTSAQLP